MAKVFTPEQVATNSIPEEGNFQIAARTLLDFLKADYDCREEIKGGLIFGSTTTGETNIRSDLDVLISLDKEPTIPMLETLKSMFREIEDTWFVQVEPIVYSVGRLATAQHTIDPIFATHLQLVDHTEWGVGSNPLEVINFEDTTTQQLFDKYALHKESKFKKATLSTDTNIDYKVFQRALEIPRSMGRKAMALIEDPNGHSNLQTNLHEVASHETLEHIQYITDVNDAYNWQLSATIGGNTDQLNNYAKWLHDIYGSTVFSALAFTRSFMNDVQIHIEGQEVSR